MNMLIDFKKFHIKILVHMKKTYDVTIDHMVHFVGSKLGLYVSFLIPLYNSNLPSIFDLRLFLKCKERPFLRSNLNQMS